MARRQTPASCKDTEGQFRRHMFSSTGLCIWLSSEVGHGTEWNFGLWGSSRILSSHHTPPCILTVWSSPDVAICSSCWRELLFRSACEDEWGELSCRSVWEDGTAAGLWAGRGQQQLSALRWSARCPDFVNLSRHPESQQWSTFHCIIYFIIRNNFHH